MLDRLPEQIEPIGLADVGRSFRGVVMVSRLERLAPLLATSEGEFNVEMQFKLDERCIRTLRGSIRGELDLVCQRCLDSLRFPIDLDFRLGVIASDDEIARLPDGFEPLLVSGDPIRTIDLIEDEVLLAVPAFPMHEGLESCQTRHVNQAVPDRENPFSVLQKLKR